MGIVIFVLISISSYPENINFHKNFLVPSEIQNSRLILPRKYEHKPLKYNNFSLLEEILVDTTKILVGAPFEQRECNLTFLNNKWLCVWTDFREYYDPFEMQGIFKWSEIYGNFIDESGNLLLNSFAISNNYGGVAYPSASAGNSNFLVVWQDYRIGSWETPQIFGTIIDTFGNKIDSLDFHISNGLEGKENYFPSCAFDGNNYLVVWYSYDNYELFQIYGKRISQNGNFVDPFPVKISNFMPFPFILPFTSPSISFDGNYYLITFEGTVYDDQNIYGIRITPSMQIIDQNPLVISNANNWQWRPSSIYKNGYHFIVWTDQRNGINNVYGARFTPSGYLLDPDGITISSSNSGFPSVSSDENNYFVAWHDWREGNYPLIYGARVSPSGNVLDPYGIKFSNSNKRQMYAKIKYGLNNYLSIWEDYRNSYLDIYGTRITKEGNVLDPNSLIISSSVNFHFNPKCAFDGNNYTIVWEDWRENNGNYSDIYGIRLDSYGNILHTNSFPVSELGSWTKVFPSIASSGMNYLVVWTDKRNNNWDIYGVRLDLLGNRIEPLDIPISNKWSTEYYPKVIYGNNYFVVWEDAREGALNSIYGARINKFGQLIDTAGIKVSINTNTFKIFPDISYGENEYFVAWTDVTIDSSGHYWYSILGTRLNQNGKIIDSNGIIIADAGSDTFGFEDHFAFPSIAFSGINYLIAYNRFEYIGNYLLGFDIFFTLIDNSGNIILKEIPVIAWDSHDQMFPSCIFDGENYLIVWQDERDGSFGIYGVHITPNGEILEPNGFPLISSRFLRANPSLAKGPSNQVLISYQGFIRDDYSSYRTLASIYNSFSVEEFSDKKQKFLFISPNPFINTTTISFYKDSDRENDAVFSIFDLNGRLIKNYNIKTKQKGIYKIFLDGKSMPPGIYFGVLNIGNRKMISKILKLK